MKPDRTARLFLNPAAVARIQDLSLRARLIVEGFLVGLHRSPYHGFSVEFKEYREYTPGDDPRWIDWKAYARSDRFYVKRFEEETNLRAYLVVDASGSMGFPEGPHAKLTYAVNLAAALAYLFHLQRDATGLLVFNGGIVHHLPPRTSRMHLFEIFKALAGLKAQGPSAPERPIHLLTERMKKRGLVLLFSDLMTRPEPLLKALSFLRQRKHEVVVFHLLAPEELQLQGQGPAVFRDLETGERLAFDPRTYGRDYERRLQAFLDHLRWSLRARNIDYQFLRTDEPFDRALLFYLKKREHLP